MAEDVVSLLVNRVGPLVADLFIQETKFLCGVRDQVRRLQVELTKMQSFLANAKVRQDEEIERRVNTWFAEMRDIACDVEDVIEMYAFKVASRKKGGIKKVVKRFACILEEGIEVHKVGLEIEKITTKISVLSRNLEPYFIKERDGGDPNCVIERLRDQRETAPRAVDDTNVIGFEKNIENVVAYLVNKEKQQHRVVSIYGMGGLGKTTLAMKIFHHQEVKDHFDYRAWAYISPHCQKREVLKKILFSLLSFSNEQRKGISEWRDFEIADKILQIQKEKKCLVILDDIWDRKTWHSLSNAFPETNTGSKILMTTRIRDLASWVDPTSFPYILECLNDEQGWKLLQKIALSTRNVSEYKTEMENSGKEMVRCCGGLPLAIIVLGGLLATKQTPEEWEKVNEHVKLHLVEPKDELLLQVLTLSYNDLPYHLKQCLLYLVHIPENFEISKKKLIRMWMAEGFIQLVQDTSGKVEKLEDRGERYLCQLEQRCMVQSGTKGSMSGRIKTCRVHDVMRHLCRKKAEDENFLQCINYQAKKNLAKENLAKENLEVQIVKVRRFSICCNEVPIELISLISEECPRIRSLLYFLPNYLPIKNGHLKSSIFVPQNHSIKNGQLMSSMFKDFKFLRVLNLDNFEVFLSKLPKEIGYLIHLRFLTLRGGCEEELPSSLGNLRYLQTLDLQFFSCPQVIIPKVIQKMKLLRHLYLPYNCVIRGKLMLANLSHLQTLANIPLSCDLEGLAELNNLTKFRIRLEGTLEKDAKILMPKLEILQSLRIVIDPSTEGTDIRPIVSKCPNIYKLRVENKIEKLPEVNVISHCLTKLDLRSTFLKEDPMPTLEKYPKLKILNLYEAFKGKKVVCSATGFPQLQSLYLENLLNLEEWTVEKGAMPRLCRLRIEDCNGLRMVPEGLTTLKELEIINMPKEFTDKIDKEGQDFYKIQDVRSVVIKNRYST